MQRELSLKGRDLFNAAMGFGDSDGQRARKVDVSDVVPADNCLKFIDYIGKLKQVQRTGWVRRGIKHPESVCDHSYRMALLCCIISDNNIDKTKAMKMALIHDLPECVVGDIAPGMGISDEEKHAREAAAFKMILDDGFGSRGNGLIFKSEMNDIYHEYEERKSAESKLVKDLDRLDMIAQACEYEVIEGNGFDLSEFIVNYVSKIEHKEVRAWAEKLALERQARRAR